ncbi:MAG: hypothetical protein DMG13_15665 [Acidobacteria bacterium]|nr:MAG: hypothetical protein DMG13_15665 [Acidobacteriota bacterium]
MPVLSDEGVDVAGRGLFDCSDAPFIVRCQCARIWNVTAENAHPGQPTCVSCVCGVDLVAWNGVTGFALSLVSDPYRLA